MLYLLVDSLGKIQFKSEQSIFLTVTLKAKFNRDLNVFRHRPVVCSSGSVFRYNHCRVAYVRL
jgi:hypothetical protein